MRCRRGDLAWLHQELSFDKGSFEGWGGGGIEPWTYARYLYSFVLFSIYVSKDVLIWKYFTTTPEEIWNRWIVRDFWMVMVHGICLSPNAICFFNEMCRNFTGETMEVQKSENKWYHFYLYTIIFLFSYLVILVFIFSSLLSLALRLLFVIISRESSQRSVEHRHCRGLGTSRTATGLRSCSCAVIAYSKARWRPQL